METEIFRDVEGYEGLYQISNEGIVKSIWFGKERILKPRKDRGGYYTVGFWKDRKLKWYKVHRLVATAFIPNPDNLPQVNHKDECKTNNTVENLEWCTQEYNNNYGVRNEKATKTQINDHKKSKPVLCVETGVVYPSTHEVYRQLGYSDSHISKCCNGRLKTAYKYHWKYV